MFPTLNRFTFSFPCKKNNTWLFFHFSATYDKYLVSSPHDWIKPLKLDSFTFLNSGTQIQEFPLSFLILKY